MAYGVEEKELISNEIGKCLKKGFIIPCDKEKENFISTIFKRKREICAPF